MKFIVIAAISAVLVAGCYSMRQSSGGGQTDFSGSRGVDSNQIALLNGYRIESIAEGLTFPTGVTFDEDGNVYVVESGYAYGEMWTTPRLLRVEPDGKATVIGTGGGNGPWNGVVWHGGAFYIAEGGVRDGGRILRMTLDGRFEPIVTDLPSLGDHHTNGPAVGGDGYIYFGQGTATNSGVVGEDNYKFGWLKRNREFHDIPGQDVVLRGENFKSADPMKTDAAPVETGAFSPFGTRTKKGQVIKGQVKASGSILRVRPDGSGLEQVAWGFRNPFGLAFSPDGRLYATDNGYDERGSRPAWGTPDVLWEVKQGIWYGWPDFAAGKPLTDDAFKAPGKGKCEFLIANHPNAPPSPVVRFAVHSSADGFDFSRSERFGFVGDAFVALFGDAAPAVGKVLHPVGYKIVHVDMKRGVVRDFAVNRGAVNGPASRIGTDGFERPVALRFSPSGEEMYVVDFGVMLHDGQGAKPKQNTGVLWRITNAGNGVVRSGSK